MSVDTNGHIRTPAEVPYQAEFLSILADVRQHLETGTPDLLHSVYVYGSVSIGLAVPKQSDLDLTLLLNRSPSIDDKARLEEVRKALESNHPIVSKVDFDIGTVDQVKSSMTWQYWLKHHCRCLSGPDLALGISPFKPSKELALAVNGDYREVLHRYAIRISACTTEAESTKLRREAARKTIRSSNILRGEADTDWPVSLEACAGRIQHLFPGKVPEIQYFLEQAKQPVTHDFNFVTRLIAFVDWMDEALLISIR